MRLTSEQGKNQLRKATRSIVFGAAVLIGLAAYKVAEHFPQLRDFETLIALVIGATAFALLRRTLL